MKIFARLLNLMCVLTLAGNAAAQNAPANLQPRQDAEVLRQTVEAFLNKQAAGLPGEVTIAANPVDTRLNLPACASPEAFLPPGGRLWGRTTVGVRCSAPSSWTVYLTAKVRVVAGYVAATVPLVQGHQIRAQDIATVTGDLTALPQGIVTDPTLAVGRTVAFSVQAGMPIRQDALRNQRAIQHGQIVKLISNGPGFRVAAEGKALGNASEGQIVQATASNGQMVSGIARLNGIVEVTY